MSEVDDADVLAITRFMAAMKRVLVECLDHDPNKVSDSPTDMLRYVELIRDEWTAPAPIPEVAGEVAREMRRYLQEVTAAALARKPPEGEDVAVPTAALGQLSDWLEGELANLDRMRRRAGR